MARQRDWYGREVSRIAANLVTVSDIAAWTGVPEGAATQWTKWRGFPRPLTPAAAGAQIWWWPTVRQFILDRAGELPGYIAPPDPVPFPRPRPAGKRGPNPGPRLLSPFDIRQVRAMHAQRDDQGRPRFTFHQIAAALPGDTSAALVHTWVQSRRRPPGLGGDARSLPPEKIAELRALRAEMTPAGKPRHTLKALAEQFGISDMSVSRYTADMRPAGPRRSRHQAYNAEGNPISDTLVQRVQAMHAERDASGQHRHTPEQIAEACDVTVATVGRLVRRLTGPPPNQRTE